MRHFWIWILLVLATGRVAAEAPREEVLKFERFGDVRVYREKEKPQHALLLVSDEKGWDSEATKTAQALASLDALVIGVDLRQYFQGIVSEPQACWTAAGNLERLSQVVQKQSRITVYRRPYLVGLRAGGALVYAAIAQAPTRTFLGAFSLGFQVELPASKTPCTGAGLESTLQPESHRTRLLPIRRPGVPWVVLVGEKSKAANLSTARDFVAGVRLARVVSVPGVADSYSEVSKWMPQLKQIFGELVAETPALPGPSDPKLADLPLIEVRAAHPSGILAIHLTGDGGWCGMDKLLAEELARRGIDVVAWDTLWYFWTPRTPDGVAKDLERVLRSYQEAWRSKKVLLLGFSYGADVLPFLLNRLPEDLRARVTLAGFIGISTSAAFEIGVSINDHRSYTALREMPTLPEVLKCTGIQLVCICGEDERNSICGRLPEGTAVVIRRPGGHTMGKDPSAIADDLLKSMDVRSPGAAAQTQAAPPADRPDARPPTPR